MGARVGSESRNKEKLQRPAGVALWAGVCLLWCPRQGTENMGTGPTYGFVPVLSVAASFELREEWLNRPTGRKSITLGTIRGNALIRCLS